MAQAPPRKSSLKPGDKIDQTAAYRALISVAELVRLAGAPQPHALVSERLEQVVALVNNRQRQPLPDLDTAEMVRLTASLAHAYNEVARESRRPWPQEGDRTLPVPSDPTSWKHVIRGALVACRPHSTARDLKLALLTPKQIADAGGPARAAATVAECIYDVGDGTARSRRDLVRKLPRRAFDGSNIRSAGPVLHTFLIALGCDDKTARLVALLATGVAHGLRDVESDVWSRRADALMHALIDVDMDLDPNSLEGLLDAVSAVPSPTVHEPPIHDQQWFDEWLAKPNPEVDPWLDRETRTLAPRRPKRVDGRPPMQKKQKGHRAQKSRKPGA